MAYFELSRIVYLFGLNEKALRCIQDAYAEAGKLAREINKRERWADKNFLIDGRYGLRFDKQETKQA